MRLAWRTLPVIFAGALVLASVAGTPPSRASRLTISPSTLPRICLTSAPRTRPMRTTGRRRPSVSATSAAGRISTGLWWGSTAGRCLPASKRRFAMRSGVHRLRPRPSGLSRRGADGLVSRRRSSNGPAAELGLGATLAAKECVRCISALIRGSGPGRRQPGAGGGACGDARAGGCTMSETEQRTFSGAGIGAAAGAAGGALIGAIAGVPGTGAAIGAAAGATLGGAGGYIHDQQVQRDAAALRCRGAATRERRASTPAGAAATTAVTPAAGSGPALRSVRRVGSAAAPRAARRGSRSVKQSLVRLVGPSPRQREGGCDHDSALSSAVPVLGPDLLCRARRRPLAGARRALARPGG